ncbi:hypothetical protein QJS04_geneDACA007622 [Acorus gramineus]|nr:hypothetical protein QJS04_geneDACA007622 [Acorus gramineus]
MAVQERRHPRLPRLHRRRLGPQRLHSVDLFRFVVDEGERKRRFLGLKRELILDLNKC